MLTPPSRRGYEYRCAHLLLALLLGWSALIDVRPAQAQLEEKVDSLRWLAYQHNKRGEGELFNWQDSLRACINEPGDGVTITPGGDGDGDGTSVTFPGLDVNDLPIGGGITITWEGREPDGIPFDFTTIRIDRVPEGGFGIGIDPNPLEPDSIRIRIFDGDIPITIIDVPPPDPDPDPGPDPNPPVIINLPDSSTSCDKWFLDLVNGGADGSGAGGGVSFGSDVSVAVSSGSNGATQAFIGDRILFEFIRPKKNLRYLIATHLDVDGLHELTLIDETLFKLGHEHRGSAEGAFEVSEDDLSFAVDAGTAGAEGIETLFKPGTKGVDLDLASLSLANGNAVWFDVSGTLGERLFSLKVQRQGSRTQFTPDALASTGWTKYTVQYVRNGQVVRQTTVNEGAALNLPLVTLQGFGRASIAEEGWYGFYADVVFSSGSAFQVRFLPTTNNVTFDVTSTELRASAAAGLTLTLLGVNVSGVTGPVLYSPAPVMSDARPEAGGTLLLSNHPNPFNPATTIAYTLPATAQVRLAVYDVMGRLVATLADGVQQAGQYEARFDATHLASGLYFYRLEAGRLTQTRQMLLVK